MVQFTARANGTFAGMGLIYACAIGKNGLISQQDMHEGDGASPIGKWPMRYVYYRPDRVAPPATKLDIVPLSENDGWCDDPDDPLYNCPVSLPYKASYEVLWREDHVYDLIVVLGHNDNPVVSGKGSAVFLHLARPDFAPTEGCIALNEADLRQVLRLCGPDSVLEIAP